MSRDCGQCALALIAAWLICPAVVRAAGAAPPGPTAARQRIMVMQLQSTGVAQQISAPLNDIIAREIGQHTGYDVASSDDVDRLTAAQGARQLSGCAQDEECVLEISRKLQADLVVSGSVGMIGQKYVLSLSLTNPRHLGKATGALESVARVDDLPKAVLPCLAKLFKWGKTTEARSTFHLPKGRKLAFAVMDLRPTGLSEETAQNLTQVLTVEVKGVDGASVVSRQDINSMLQLNATKMELGCGDDSCMAQIGGALGVDRLIAGDAGRLGQTFIINLRLIDVRKGEIENRITETFNGDEEQLLRAVRHAGRELLGLNAIGSGRIAITVSQNESQVFVDQALKGRAPLAIESLGIGPHALRVSHDGFFDWHSDVYVDSAETTSIWALMKERPQAWYQR